MKIESVRGTRDFYPEDKARQNFIFSTWRSVCEKYGYRDYDGPLLEPAKMWQLKSGAEISEQMYTLTDKSNRLLAIRPELTPTLARMIAEKQREMPKPIRLYSIARCWRYEAPQSGRLREFFQLNADIFGSESMALDAEIIATSIDILKSFGLTKNDFYIRLGNRKLIESLLCSVSPKSKLKEVSRLIDKLDKIGKKEFLSESKKIGIDGQKIIEVLSQDINSIKIDDKTGEKGLEELKGVLRYLKAYKMQEYVEIDLTIMRGFDYYTSTVFELFDREKKLRAIMGGGRYDDLVGEFGGSKLPGIGYGLGDVVLELFLKKKGKLPKYDPNIDYFIAIIGEENTDYAISVAQELRKKSNVTIEVMNRKIKKQIEFAKKIGAKNLIVIGEIEKKKKSYQIKKI